MLGQPLKADEWRMLLEIAEGQLGPWAAAAGGRLIMRGLVQANADGRVLITARGLDVLGAAPIVLLAVLKVRRRMQNWNDWLTYLGGLRVDV